MQSDLVEKKKNHFVFSFSFYKFMDGRWCSYKDDDYVDVACNEFILWIISK